MNDANALNEIVQKYHSKEYSQEYAANLILEKCRPFLFKMQVTLRKTQWDQLMIPSWDDYVLNDVLYCMDRYDSTTTYSFFVYLKKKLYWSKIDFIRKMKSFFKNRDQFLSIDVPDRRKATTDFNINTVDVWLAYDPIERQYELDREGKIIGYIYSKCNQYDRFILDLHLGGYGQAQIAHCFSNKFYSMSQPTVSRRLKSILAFVKNTILMFKEERKRDE